MPRSAENIFYGIYLSGIKVVRREYIFLIVRQNKEEDFGKKMDVLKFKIVNELTFPTEPKTKSTKTFSRIRSKKKVKWQMTKRIETVFLNKYYDWLQSILDRPKNSTSRAEKNTSGGSSNILMSKVPITLKWKLRTNSL